MEQTGGQSHGIQADPYIAIYNFPYVPDLQTGMPTTTPNKWWTLLWGSAALPLPPGNQTLPPTGPNGPPPPIVNWEPYVQGIADWLYKYDPTYAGENANQEPASLEFHLWLERNKTFLEVGAAIVSLVAAVAFLF